MENDALSSNKENHPNYDFTKADVTAKLVSLTPRRNQAPPRAWQRRPATPFVPRNEGQKIWKRVPLQELGVEANQAISRRETKEKEDYTRTVKRLKLDEGSVVGKAQALDKFGKSKPASGHGGSVGTKWEEDHIEAGGSPKKKPRTVLAKTQTDCDNVEVWHVGERDTATEDVVLDATESTEVVPVEASMLMPNQAATISEHDLDEVECTTNKDEAAVLNANSSAGQDDVRVSESRDIGSEDQLDKNETHRHAPEILPTDQVSVIQETDINHASEDVTSGFDQEELAVASIRVADPDLSSSIKAASPQPDASAIRDSSTTSEAAGVLAAELVPAQATARATATFSDPEHEDTAFLSGWLARERAQKAARTVADPQEEFSQPDPETVEAAEGTPLGGLLREEDSKDLDSVPTTRDQAQVQKPGSHSMIGSTMSDSESDRISTRSSSRLPRFQNLPPVPHFGPVLASQNTALPSTIQLRRATGSEFIFSCQPQSSTAWITRSNTKKNQAESVNVMTRLTQLSQEMLPQSSSLEEDSIETNNRQPQTSSATIENADKKRKRSKKDEGSRERKSVKWLEEIATYREASPYRAGEDEDSSFVRNPFDDIQTFPPISLLPSSPISAERDELIFDQNTRQAGLKADTEISSSRPSKEESKLKVRRIRKINVGSVNGTPAPKTRSRSSKEEYDEHSAKAEIGNHVQNGSSRMPVPVSTPIPLPSLTESSSKKSNKTKSDKPAVATELKDRENKRRELSQLRNTNTPNNSGTTTSISEKPKRKTGVSSSASSTSTSKSNKISDQSSTSMTNPSTSTTTSKTPTTTSTSTSTNHTSNRRILRART